MFLQIVFLLSFIGVQGTDPILIQSNEKRTSNFRAEDQSQRNSEIVSNDLELNLLADGPSWEILNYEGHSQSIEVPNSANWIEVIAYGASGGDYAGNFYPAAQGSYGGKGGCIQAQIPVNAKQTSLLYAYIGGQGNSYIGMGGWNGGGSGTLIKGDGYGSGGGGSTDIRLSSSLSDRIVVAGGGGGWGYCKGSKTFMAGGSGGDLVGNNGGGAGNCTTGGGGYGATQSSGGDGGGYGNGEFGFGASGINGGGGGYYGGGSGAGTGGGGGSSYTSGTIISTSANCNSGNGLLKYRFLKSLPSTKPPTIAPTRRVTGTKPTLRPTDVPSFRSPTTRPNRNPTASPTSNGCSTHTCNDGTYKYGSNRLQEIECSSAIECQSKCCYETRIIQVNREVCNANGIFGTLQLGASAVPTGLVTLENPQYAIPTGTYRANFRYSPSLGYITPYLYNEDTGRSYILFHIGNYQKNSQGCVLIGSKWDSVTDPKMIVQSQAGFLSLMQNILKFSVMTGGNQYSSDSQQSLPSSLLDDNSVLLDYPIAPLKIIIKEDSNYESCSPSSSSSLSLLSDSSSSFQFQDFTFLFNTPANSYNLYGSQKAFNYSYFDRQIQKSLSSLAGSTAFLYSNTLYYEDPSDHSLAILSTVAVDTSVTSSVLQQMQSKVSSSSSSFALTTNSSIPQSSVVSSVQTCPACSDGFTCDSQSFTCQEAATDDGGSSSSSSHWYDKVAWYWLLVIVIVIGLILIACGTVCCRRYCYPQSTGASSSPSSEAPVVDVKYIQPEIEIPMVVATRMLSEASAPPMTTTKAAPVVSSGGTNISTAMAVPVQSQTVHVVPSAPSHLGGEMQF